MAKTAFRKRGKIISIPKRGYKLLTDNVKIYVKDVWEKMTNKKFPYPDDCIGCSLYGYIFNNSSWTTVCDIVHTKKSKKCPCIYCLVKMKCETLCDELEDFRNNVKDEKVLK